MCDVSIRKWVIVNEALLWNQGFSTLVQTMEQEIE
ncbi:hypothetical protein JOD43_001040 [Pullulanibacillus pueri]|nr:hypothetical protein [Pullulanibacillus pueri]